MVVLQPVRMETKREYQQYKGMKNRLKSLRKINRKKVEDVAEFLGIAPSTYQGYEFGKREPKLEGLFMLAQYFNTSTDYLLGLSDNPSPKDPPREVVKFLDQVRRYVQVENIDPNRTEK